ncbi:MAG TPA: hypothetical protein ENO30_04680 [Thermodesulfobium narugense]|nr:hypothetical protein [Thermodesulfobium narugense]
MSTLKRIVWCSILVSGFILSSCANMSMYSSSNHAYDQQYRNKEEREIADMRQELYYSYDNFLRRAQQIMSQGPKNVK